MVAHAREGTGDGVAPQGLASPSLAPRRITTRMLDVVCSCASFHSSGVETRRVT